MLEEESLRILGNKGLNPVNSTFLSKMQGVLFILLDNIFGFTIMIGLFYNTLDTYAIIDSCNGTAIIFQVVIKQVILLVYKEEFADVIYRMEKFWPPNKFGKKSAMKIKNILILLRKLLVIFKRTILMTAILYLVKPLMEGKRELPLTWLNYCNSNESILCYISSYIIQSCGVGLTLYGLVGFDGLFFILLSYGYCELEHMKYAFDHLRINLNVPGDETQVLQMLCELVRQHNRVLIFIIKVNKLFTNVLLCQFITSVAALCTGLFLLTAKGFPPTLSLTLRYVPYITSALCQISIYCIAGQIIGDQRMMYLLYYTNYVKDGIVNIPGNPRDTQPERVFYIGKSESIADSAFKTYWWAKRQPGMSKSIILIIQRAQRRTEITAVGVFKLDLSTFVSILRGSVSALTLMQTFYSPPETET